MIRYYREKNGDYLAIDTDTNRHYRELFGQDHFEGRASAIAGLPSSTCSTTISRQYLREKCRRVARAKVPVEWMKAIGLEADGEGP